MSRGPGARASFLPRIVRYDPHTATTFPVPLVDVVACALHCSKDLSSGNMLRMQVLWLDSIVPSGLCVRLQANYRNYTRSEERREGKSVDVGGRRIMRTRSDEPVEVERWLQQPVEC